MKNNNGMLIRVPRRVVLMVMVGLLLMMPAFLPTADDSHKAYAAVTLTDLNGHWAKSYIEDAVKEGFVSGYEDGTFRPDQPIKRAEFTKMVNSALGVTRIAELNFTDVSQDMWYWQEICKGVAAAYINGKGDGVFAPDEQITRQEAAVMLARIVPAYAVNGKLENYTDSGAIADWARPSFNKMVGKTYLGKYSDGLLHPTDSLTRAQAAKILVEIVKGEKIIKQNQTVVATGVTLSSTIYTGQISVGEKVEEGITTFTNCTVLGTLNVQSGGTGENGVTLMNTRVANAKIHKEDSEVRVVAQGETNVVNTTVSNAALLEEVSLMRNGEFGQGYINVTTGRGADLSLIGDFQNVSAAGAKSDITLKQGTIQNLSVPESSDRTVVNLEKETQVDTAEIYANSTKLTGVGLISSLHAHANNIMYETEPEEIIVDPSVVDPPYLWQDPWNSLIMTSSPTDGEQGVPVNSGITLEFSAPIHLTGGSGSVLTDLEAESVIVLREGFESGKAVSMTATVTNSGKTVTLIPDANLKGGTSYYLQIAKGVLSDVYSHENELTTVVFTTEQEKEPTTVRVSPTNRAVGVERTIQPKLTFSDAVTGAGGKALTAEVLSAAVTLKKINSEGVATDVAVDLSIDEGKTVITVAPRVPLDKGSTFQLNLDGTQLQRESDGTAVPSLSTTFTTGIED